MRLRPVHMARWSARHPWRAITGWFLFVLLCLGAGIAAGNNPATTKDFWVGEAGHAESMATEGGLQRRPVEHVLIRSASGPLDTARATGAARELTARMRALDEVREVQAPVASKDGTALRVSVVMEGAELDGRKNVVPLLAETAEVAAAHPDLVVEETGSPAISKGVNDQRGDDLALSERLSLPVTLLILLAVFGSVVMAGVPLLLALSSIAATMGLSMLASHLLPDPGVGTNMILLMGLAVGVDYTLFYLKREREERARAGGRLGPEALVELAAATAGRAVVISGLAVIVCTATLYLATDVIFSSLATGTILVVAVAVLSSLTVLPALLVKLGHRAERRAARKAARRARRGAPATAKRPKPENGRVFTALLRPARRHPVATLCASVLVMLAVAAPALGLRLVDPGKDTFSRSIPAMRVYDRLTAAYPELLVKHEVVTRTSPGRAPEVRAALTELGRRAQADPLFARTAEPVVRTSADGRVTVLELAVPHPAPSDEAIASLDHLRDRYIPSTVGKLSGVDTAVSGDVARGRDYVHHERGKLPLVIGFLLLLTFVTTAVAFRSAVIGLIGVVLNLLSAAAALGALVLVFQGTWAEGLLGFDSLGAIASRVPLFLFVLLFGLSMDYQVFVVSRIKEAMDHGMTAREAVLEGIARSAKVVTSAALVMVTIFAAFVFLHLTEMKQMGFCLAVAVLLDAVVIRMMILPSLLLLLGERAWPRKRPAPAAVEHLPVG
ncbi:MULTISPECIES: MMPL family transporter [unclassified Streptomyces]|uniref:MMPL family transporter n=1 Tax=unclassified Streptomyces TaxID=2593676 RepID=UPI002ED2D886|nr:MMPL family transporter [Streptomyces sp. NBC_00891]WSY06380.1 MMPL family transporter [Streptomyces sp. NBC_00890]WSZ08004.1 MMPL family transporter [Streptomyces sp. NBC_00869]WSZ24496.1 MMPL family transporter [Streptomyces sp. NBC_00870]